MGFYLLIVILVGMLIIWKCKSWQSQIPARKRKLKRSERLLLVTAHPDDECMFFGPLIITAVRKWCLDDVFILCCSTGDHYGEGNVRIQELSAACEVLGVHRDNIQCISDPLLPDSPLFDWNHARLKAVIHDALTKWNPTVIVTFDERGVSGHRNHCDIAKCLITMQQSSATSMKGRRLLLLDTVNPIRKYMRYVDIPFTLFGGFDLLTVANREHTEKIEFGSAPVYLISFTLFCCTFHALACMDVRQFQKIWTFQENRTHHALGEKCKEATVLKNQLKTEIDYWRDILRDLQLMYNRARNALYWTKLPLDINHEVVNLLVKAVQETPDFLMKAIKDEATTVIQRSDELLKIQQDIRQKEMEANQIRSQLEVLWNDKSMGLEMDVIAHNISVDSRFITYKPLAEGSNLAVHHNKEGDSQYRITDTVKRSGILRDLHRKFLNDCDRGLSFTAAAVRDAHDKVVSALAEGHRLAQRMKELNEEQLLAAGEEKERLKKEYLDLRNAVHDNNRSLMLTETRMFTRTQKPVTEQEDDEANKALLDQLGTIQKVYRDNVLPMKSLDRGVQDLLDSEIDISRSIELVNNKLITAYEQCVGRGRFYPSSKQLLGFGNP